MLTPDATWQELKNGPIYMNFDANSPIRVWVVEHEVYAYRGLEVRPFTEIKGLTGLVWVLVEASAVSRCRYGVSVTFWKGGATGWFPYGNARFPSNVTVQPQPNA